MTNVVDYEAQFNARKPLPKKQVMKIQPLTFIRIKRMDAPDQLVLLLEKPKYEKGDVSLKYVCGNGRMDSHAVHTQVMEVLGSLEWPALVLGPKQ